MMIDDELRQLGDLVALVPQGELGSELGLDGAAGPHPADRAQDVEPLGEVIYPPIAR